MTSVYQEWKTLMMGMRQDVRVYIVGHDTLIELTHKLNLDSHILNFVPIQVKHSDLYQTSFEAGDP